VEKHKALIVDDDAEVVDEVADVLIALGHEHDVAASLEDARTHLADGEHSYLLLNPMIRARVGRGKPRAQNGVCLLEQINASGARHLPVIVLVDHRANSPMPPSEALNWAVAMVKKGAADAASKPFSSTGYTLDTAIKKVLRKKRKRRPKRPKSEPVGQRKAGELQPFAGGIMAFYPNRAELCGEVITERSQRGRSRKVLEILRGPNRLDNYVCYSGERLAEQVDRRIGQNAIAQCVADMRTRITEIMRDRLGVACGKYDVIDNRGKGYHLRGWIQVEVHDGSDHQGQAADGTGDICGDKRRVTGDSTRDTGQVTGDRRAGKPNVPDGPANVPANARQKWILGEVAQDRKLRRRDVEKRFDVSPRTVKRDLKGLADQRLIEFVPKGRSGYYRLKQR